MDKKEDNNSEKELRASLNYLRREIAQNPIASQKIKKVDPAMRRQQLIKKIQKVVLKFVRSAGSTHEDLSLAVRPRRVNWNQCDFSERLKIKKEHELAHQEINYYSHKRRFQIIFNLLSRIYHLLLTESTVTKRELYYEQTELFGNQSAVTWGLLDVCSLLDACPWELRVFSTSKGLVAGDLSITTSDKQVINCMKSGGVLVPQDIKGIRKIESSAKFILLVEKDAAFQKLLDDRAHVRLGPCIMMTGKGEPDMNTRLLVNRLFTELQVPVFIVVDADPYGIEIMCTYRFGSLALVQHTDELAVPQIKWLGVHPTDVTKLFIPTTPFTARDFAKARDLAQRPYIQNNELLLEQVNCLLASGRKCEIENLTALSPSFLTDLFLPYKISARELI